MKTSVALWLNDTDRGKQKYWERNLSQCHCVHQKSHMDWPGIEAGSARLIKFIHKDFTTPHSRFCVRLERHSANNYRDLKCRFEHKLWTYFFLKTFRPHLVTTENLNLFLSNFITGSWKYLPQRPKFYKRRACVLCTHASRVILCSHNTDNVCTTSTYPHWTKCVILAKHWLWLPDDGFLVNRNTLEQPP
jgi:hypothetical protein